MHGVAIVVSSTRPGTVLAEVIHRQVGNDSESGGGWAPGGTIAPQNQGLPAVNNSVILQ